MPVKTMITLDEYLGISYEGTGREYVKQCR